MRKLTLFLIVFFVLILASCSGNDSDNIEGDSENNREEKENAVSSSELKKTLSEKYDLDEDDILLRDEVEAFIQDLKDEADEDELEFYETDTDYLYDVLVDKKNRIVGGTNKDIGYIDDNLDIEENEQLMNKYVMQKNSFDDQSYDGKVGQFYGNITYFKEIYNPTENRIEKFESDLKESSKAEKFVRDINAIDANADYNDLDEFIEDLHNGGVFLDRSFGYLSRLTESSFDNNDVEYLIKDTNGFKEYADGVYLGYPFVTLDHGQENLYLEMQTYIPENHDLKETKELFEQFDEVSINGRELSNDNSNYDIFMDNKEAFEEYENKNVLYKDTMFTVGIHLNQEDIWDENAVPDDVDLLDFYDLRDMFYDNKTPNITLDINGEELILDERISKTPVEHEEISNLYEIKDNFNLEPKIVEN